MITSSGVRQRGKEDESFSSVLRSSGTDKKMKSLSNTHSHRHNVICRCVLPSIFSAVIVVAYFKNQYFKADVGSGVRGSSPHEVRSINATSYCVAGAAGIIPQRLIFTDKTNILKETSDDNSILRKNVLNTIRLYKESFLSLQQQQQGKEKTNTTIDDSDDHDENVIVNFMTDKDCLNVLQDAEPKLVTHFKNEREGKFKADLCRIAELYLHGGYYFDVDLEVIKPIILRKEVSFITVRETADFGTSGFFQAFLAGTAEHPIFRYALDEMLTWYIHPNEHRRGENLGTTTLKKAYDKFVSECGGRGKGDLNKLLLLLKEDKLEGEMKRSFPQVQPQVPSSLNSGYGCNFVVHDRKYAYFFSRVMGAKTNNVDGPGCWR